MTMVWPKENMCSVCGCYSGTYHMKNYRKDYVLSETLVRVTRKIATDFFYSIDAIV